MYKINTFRVVMHIFAIDIKIISCLNVFECTLPSVNFFPQTHTHFLLVQMGHISHSIMPRVR